MNYEFHVGDYVETWGGISGHISKLEKWRHPAFIEDSVWFVYTTGKGNSYYFESEVSQLKYEFQRIGKYDFTKKEKKKIDNLVKPQWSMPVEDLICKINELVDAVNKLMDKEEDR